MNQIKSELCAMASPEKTEALKKFFKTGEGEYGYGDSFLGIVVPLTRGVAKSHAKTVEFNEIIELLHDEYHECRLAALLVLVEKYGKSTDNEERDRIFEIYIENIPFINNWDLVDLSAPGIVGEHLFGKDCSILYRLAKSGSLWGERVAIVSTLTFIRRGNFSHTFALVEILLDTKRDLIQKASGWMLREIGKRDKQVLVNFLNEYRHVMPRTMLRYAIEKFDAQERKYFMAR